MRIGFNAICAENRSGTGRYATQLLLALAAIDSSNTYFVCVREDSPLVGLLKNQENFHVENIAPSGVVRQQWFERFRLREWILCHDLDLFHGPAFVIPARCPVPSVVTIHDLVFHLFPETVSLSRRWHYRASIPRSIREASCILADSESTARDLRKHFGVEKKKIATVPLGVDERFFQVSDEAARHRVRECYQLPERFVLTVGTLEPRKNLPTLLRAYARLRESVPATPDLVVMGRTGWKVAGIRRQLRESGLADHVHLPGFARDKDLPPLYQMADLFVCASVYEGFGLPVLEAMASGVPVVASDNSSLPEVVGETGWLTRADDAEAIARTLREVLNESDYAQKRAALSRERARTFSWRSTAEKTLAAYASLASVL